MSTNIQDLVGFQKYVRSCALDESSLSIERVNHEVLHVVKGQRHNSYKSVLILYMIPVN